jgi:hypothetical protein
MMHAITVEEICKKLKPVLGKKVDLLYLKYSLSEEKAEKEQIASLLNVLYEKHLNTTLLDEKILVEPPAENIVNGEYPLGVVVYGGRDFGTFGLREQDWPRHVCVSGMSGSGKTTFAFQILANFILHKKPFVIFDWKKSFRPLMNLDKEILCFTVGNDKISNLFRVNINKPPKGVGPKEWVSILCDLIIESFYASYGVQKILRETIDQAFKDFGVYGGSGNYPTWKQIKDRLEEKADSMKRKSRESEWMESALRIADSLTFGSFGEAVSCKDNYGFDIEELLTKKVIFELHALGSAEKKFFCEYLLTSIYFMKKFNQESYGEEFRNAIVVDEAHHIFLKDKATFMKESITEVIYRELREYGISLICLDQHISKLSEVVAGNSATNIAFQQVLPQDVETVSGIMQLKEYKKYFSMLPVGEAILRLAERHYSPFHIKVPFIKIKDKMVADEEVKKRMDEIVKYHKQKKVFVDRCKEDNIKKAMNKIDLIYKIGGVDTSGAKISKEDAVKVMEDSNPELKVSIPIEEEHIAFMKVVRKPIGTTEAYGRLELSSRKCDKIKNDLIGQGLVDVEEVYSNKGRVKKLKLTEKGIGILKEAKK